MAGGMKSAAEQNLFNRYISNNSLPSFKHHLFQRGRVSVGVWGECPRAAGVMGEDPQTAHQRVTA